MYALLTNFTIDDKLGDSQSGQGPIYTPQQAWLLGNKTQRHLHNLTGHRVDPDFAFDQTWHQTTYNPSNDSSTPPNISVTFRGSAVYVYNILVGPISLQTMILDITSPHPACHQLSIEFLCFRSLSFPIKNIRSSLRRTQRKFRNSYSTTWSTPKKSAPRALWAHPLAIRR